MKIAALLYFIGLFNQGWYGLAAPLLDISWIARALDFIRLFIPTTRNFLCFGLLCVLLGYMSGEKQLQLPVGKTAVGFVGCMALYAAEVLIVHHHDLARGWDMLPMTVPSAYLFFALSLAVRRNAGERDFAFLRPYGNLIYYAHLGAISFLSNVLPFYDGLNSLIRYALAVCSCVMGAFILLRLEKLKGLGWLGYLHR